MIQSPRLHSELRLLAKRLEKDLLERSKSDDNPEIRRILQEEYDRARSAGRTNQAYEAWRGDQITQMAAAWTLSVVFVRFMEDNALIEPPRLAGPPARLRRARDEYELYFRAHPTHSDRDYLLALFDEFQKLPAAGELFGPRNPIRELPQWLSGDAAGELLRFFQRIDAATGKLAHDFTDPEWDTRFLGDLYQHLSDEARERYALLQTPIFVEEFILDRTLEPALNEFGLEDFRLIDPACGSGHFLLGAFDRLFDRWQRREPGTEARILAQKALGSIHGVDINPDALAIARFRLMLAALRVSGIRRLADAPDFTLNLACGDALLHAPLQGILGLGIDVDDECDHAYPTEDLQTLRRLLASGRYHAVVANPPYITPKDPKLNARYRRRFIACHRQYALSVPFMEQLFRLALRPPMGSASGAGYVGQITANSFMKREFGKKLVEAFLPTVDLTHLIDTAGAYIPGHGTPTVILFGRNRKPIASTVRAVLGIRGEPSAPENPALGVVWSAIVAQTDCPGSQSPFVSVSDMFRAQLFKHPWSIGGGGAVELKERIENVKTPTVGELSESVGRFGMTSADEIMPAPKSAFERRGVERAMHRLLVIGDEVRDWKLLASENVLFPYDNKLLVDIRSYAGMYQWLWPYRTELGNRATFSKKTYFQEGRSWWEWHQVAQDRTNTPNFITFAEVATHNHFVFDTGNNAYKQTAPIIKLADTASEEDHVKLIGALNSSVACFWLKQICHNKGSTVDQRGARQRTNPFEDFYAFNASNIARFPLPGRLPLELSRSLHGLGRRLQELSPDFWMPACRSEDIAAEITRQRREWELTRARLIALQEELDWRCYELYGLTSENLTFGAEPPPLSLGERAFEIVMARQMAAGELETTWFARHGSQPITEVPAHWPAAYRELTLRRIALIQSDRDIALIEQPEYKRRWNLKKEEGWDEQVNRALRNRLLDRMESWFDYDGRMNPAGTPTAQFDPNALVSLARLADFAGRDPDFQQTGAIYRADPAFDVARLVEELVLTESVPLLPVLRYSESGRDKRAAWERTWEMQRREDAGEILPDLPAPPRYAAADFADPGFWRLRGKLDVPKERWLRFPHCQGADGTLPIAWAGCDALQQARALSAWYVEIQERVGGSADPRLLPLLACLGELLPWVRQWHNAIDPEFQQRMGDYFEGFLQEESRRLEQSLQEIHAWQPPAARRR